MTEMASSRRASRASSDESSGDGAATRLELAADRAAYSPRTDRNHTHRNPRRCLCGPASAAVGERLARPARDPETAATTIRRVSSSPRMLLARRLVPTQFAALARAIAASWTADAWIAKATARSSGCSTAQRVISALRMRRDNSNSHRRGAHWSSRGAQSGVLEDMSGRSLRKSSPADRRPEVRLRATGRMDRCPGRADEIPRRCSRLPQTNP